MLSYINVTNIVSQRAGPSPLTQWAVLKKSARAQLYLNVKYPKIEMICLIWVL